MSLRKITSLILLSVLLTPLVSSSSVALPSVITEVPGPWSDEPWSISTPAEQGMNESKLQDLLDVIEEFSISINSIVIIRNGYMVFEQYYDFYDENFKTNIFSCTKSFTSTAMGLAIDKGYVDNTSLKVLDFFPDRNISHVDSRKEAMTIEDLLTMRAGLEWDDNSASGMSNYNQMIQSDDWVQYVLDQPMIANPGTIFEYNSGASLLLSAIVQNATGVTAEAFMDEYLFEPMNITDYYWRTTPNGISIGGNTLMLNARDMAKFGCLFLRNGEWNGTQIISTNWVGNASIPHAVFTGGGYGYQWWTRSDTDSYYAAGYMGQFIHVVHEYDLVVSIKAASGIGWDPLGGFIIPAIQEGPWTPPNTTISSTTSTSETTSTTESTTMTTSTATTNLTTSGFDSQLLIVGGVGIGIVLLILIVLKRRSV